MELEEWLLLELLSEADELDEEETEDALDADDHDELLLLEVLIELVDTDELDVLIDDCEEDWLEELDRLELWLLLELLEDSSSSCRARMKIE